MWHISYDHPNCISLAREVLQHHFLNQIWNDTAIDDGSRQRPDLTAYLQLRKEYRHHGQHRQLYFLEAVVQGAMDFHTETHLTIDTDLNIVKCKHCQAVIGGESAWHHFALECKHPDAGEEFGKQQAQEEFALHKERDREGYT